MPGGKGDRSTVGIVDHGAFDHLDRKVATVTDQVEACPDILHAMISDHDRERSVGIVSDGEGGLAAHQLRVPGIVSIEDQPGAAVQGRRTAVGDRHLALLAGACRHLVKVGP